MKNKLKPCPFCGSDDIRRIITISYCEIVCNYCHAMIIRSCNYGQSKCISEAEADFGTKANNAWNARRQKK